MKSAFRMGPLLAALLVAAGCQSTGGGLRLGAEEVAVMPRAAVEAGGLPGRQVAWGGIIVDAKNLADRTRLEVLAFPLDADGYPDEGESPGGRFIADFFGFLDPVDHAPGRRVTIRGTIGRIESGRVGEASYDFPVVETVEVKLWPQTGDGSLWPPQLHIGIGVYGGF